MDALALLGGWEAGRLFESVNRAFLRQLESAESDVPAALSGGRILSYV